MKKRITSLLLAILLLATTCLSTACGNKETAGDATEIDLANQIMTREQWIIGLGSSFGMSDYITETPFFDDVENTETVYPFLQSCAEWGIFESTEGNFEPDKEVTREFAIKTAVISAEVLQPAEGENPFEQCVAYAVDKGIIDSDKQDYLTETITYGEGQEILDWAIMEFQNREFVEYSNVELNEDVIDLTESDMEYSIDSGIVTATGTTADLKVGDVFIAPGNEEAPDGIARKVTGISEDAQGQKIIETSEPALEEIYKAMDFAVRAVPTEADVITYEGVTLVSAQESDTLLTKGNDYNAYAMTWDADNYNVQKVGKGANFGFNVNFTKGKPSLNASWESGAAKFKADMEPKEPELKKGEKEAGEWFDKSGILYKGKADGTRTVDKIENKFKGGYEITGAISIKNLYVDVESETKKFLGVPVGVESFSVKTNYQVESTLKLKGSLKEEIKLTTFHIQTPVPGLTVKLEIMVYANASGELEVKFVTTNCTTTTYNDGKIKKVDSSTANAPDIKAALEIEVGLSVKAAPSVLGKEIIDVKVKGGVKFNFEPGLEYSDYSLEFSDEIWEVRTYYLTLSGTVAAPIIKLEVGTSKKCLLKLNMTWELVGTKGLVKIKEHEMFKKELRIGDVLLEKVPKASPTPMPSETPAVTPGADTGNTDGNLEPGKGIGDFNAERLDIDNYMLSVKKGEVATLTITSIPEGYTQEDIYWECGDTSVAVISNGMVTGVGVGTTQVKVYTSDGKYEIFCTIIVSDDTKVEFNAL